MRVTRIASVACILTIGLLSACASGGTANGMNTMAGDQPETEAPMTIVIR